MLFTGMTSIERNPLMPILKITVSFTKSPVPRDYIMSTMLSEIVNYIEIAEKFGGRIMNQEEYPLLGQNQQVAALIQLIFKSDLALENFRKEIKL